MPLFVSGEEGVKRGSLCNERTCFAPTSVHKSKKLSSSYEWKKKTEKRQKIVKIHFWVDSCYGNVNHHRPVIDTGKVSMINFRKRQEIWWIFVWPFKRHNSLKSARAQCPPSPPGRIRLRTTTLLQFNLLRSFSRLTKISWRNVLYTLLSTQSSNLVLNVIDCRKRSLTFYSCFTNVVLYFAVVLVNLKHWRQKRKAIKNDEKYPHF